MPKLRINLLGPIEVKLEDQLVTGFDSDKVRALLAFLAVEVDRPHRREALAGLLWPEHPERSARTSLRRALTNLRQLINDSTTDPPYLSITRQTIQFNSYSDYTLDAELLSRGADAIDKADGNVKRLEEIVKSYRGSFLEGFSLPDSAAFEEWLILTRETYELSISKIYKQLAKTYDQLGLVEKSLEILKKQVLLDPWDEQTQRQIMYLMAASGRRGDAVAHYEQFSELLIREIGVEPDQDTSDLLASIKSGQIKRSDDLIQAKSIRGYELRERLGAGSFGIVFRAYQPSVKRDVAIKLIRPEFANQPDFIRRFDVEAEIIARMEHPYIVPIYDYWREPEGAFLVMRWLQGGSLKDALVQGPWHAAACADLLDELAAALDAAHRQGIIHRDIKPANILLDGDNHGYLSDFGIATLAETVQVSGITPMTLADSRLSGTPEYISPEQAMNEPITLSADIYSLGIVLFELLSGYHPFRNTPVDEMFQCHISQPLPSIYQVRPELPRAIDDVIQKAAAKDPQDRFSTAESFASTFREAIDIGGTRRSLFTSTPVVAVNPFKGLHPFLEADAADFFGRGALIKSLIERMSSDGVADRVLAIVGPSGSGKSSVTKAGLIPALRQGALPGSEDWFVSEMVPGRHPFEELEAAIMNISVRPQANMLEEITRDIGGIRRSIRLALPDPANQLLLVIDQFEELFTFTQDPDERARFIDGLCQAVAGPDCQLILIITLRADYYDRPLQYLEFGELIRANTEVVLPLSTDEMEKAISEPAAKVGISIEPGLIGAIIGDVRQEPGALPLLQYALTELFERRQNHKLTAENYTAIGGVAGAIGRRAEELYQASDEKKREAARQLFMRLVIPGQEIQDARRRALRSEIMELQSDQFAARSADLETVMEWYGRYRLLTFDVDPINREPTIEIAHEALLREWPRFKQWIEKSRVDVHQYQRLAGAASDWSDAHYDSSFLLSGTRLEGFAGWSDKTDLALTTFEKSYLSASIAAKEQREEAERYRQDQQRSLERRTRNQRLALIIVVLVALIGAISAIVIIGADLTSEVVRAITSPDQSSAAPIANETTRIASLGQHTAYTIPQGRGVQFRPDGQQIAISGRGNAATVYDAETGYFIMDLNGHRDRINNIAYSQDGQLLATTSLDGTVKVWDADTGDLIATVGGAAGELISPAFSPNGQMVAATNYNSEFTRLTAHIWDIASGEEVGILGLGDSVGGLAFHPDDQTLAIPGENGKATLWDIATGKQFDILYGSELPLIDLVFDRSGEQLATASLDGIVRVFDVESSEILANIRGNSAGVYAIDISADGTKVATGAADGSVKVFDIKRGRELASFYGHDGAVLNVSFSPDGRFLASGGDDNNTVVWNITD